MNKLFGFIKHLLFRVKTQTSNPISINYSPGDYYYHPESCQRITVLSVPNKNYKFYDVYLYDWGDCLHTTFSIANMQNFIFKPRPDQVWKYSIEEFIESIYNAVDLTDDLDISLFTKVITRFENAAKVIQKRWTYHNTQKKLRAVRIIENHVLHYLYKPHGSLAPICFTCTNDFPFS
jgi:hypothetical protein